MSLKDIFKKKPKIKTAEPIKLCKDCKYYKADGECYNHYNLKDHKMSLVDGSFPLKMPIESPHTLRRHWFMCGKKGNWWEAKPSQGMGKPAIPNIPKNNNLPL
jgi:hypothetical protein